MIEMEKDAIHPIARKPRRRERAIFQDEKGRWWLDYYTPEGRRRRKICGAYADARSALAEIDLAKKRETFVDPYAAPTLQEYSEKYLETVSVHKESHDRERRLMKNLRDFFGASRLSKIKRSRVIEYRKVRRAKVSVGTVNREIALLRHMFNVAIDEGLVALNPARGGPGMKAFTEQSRTRYLEMDEIAVLLGAIQARIVKNSDEKLKTSAKKFWQYLHAAVVIALHTGMRKGEILSLRWEQINWERRNVLLTVTKNGEPRRVPLDSMVLHELVEHRTRVGNPDLVFPSYDRDGKVVSLGDVKVAFGRALKDAGITNFRFHDLRHTFASHYAMSGGNLYTLAKILGHKDIKMTQRYAALSPDFIDRERERMDTIWTPQADKSAEDNRQNAVKYIQ